MLRSLHIKLVLIMILLVVCLMAIAGAFLINSVNRFYLNEFYTQMVEVFSEDTEFVRDLVTAREGEQDGGEAIDQILLAKMGPLGWTGKTGITISWTGRQRRSWPAPMTTVPRPWKSSPPTS